jgi:hypothetical protein
LHQSFGFAGVFRRAFVQRLSSKRTEGELSAGCSTVVPSLNPASSPEPAFLTYAVLPKLPSSSSFSVDAASFFLCASYSVCSSLASLNLGTMPLAEVAKVIGLYNLLLEFPGVDESRLQPALVNPLLHLFHASMKSYGQSVFCEPILPHTRIRTQPPQHGADRGRRATEQKRHFRQGMGPNQIEQLLSLLVGPKPIRLFLSDAELAHESQAGIPRVSGDSNQLPNEGFQVVWHALSEFF